MTMTTDVGHARPARMPDTRAAVEYLHASSGAVAITITEHDGVWPHRLAARFHVIRDATARLRLALIPLLLNGRTIGPVQTLFEQTLIADHRG
jgi:hypothetical protein